MKLDISEDRHTHSRSFSAWSVLSGPRWFPVIFALIIICAVAIMAYIGVERRPILLLGAGLFPALVVGTLLRRRPELGLLALIPASLLVPFAVGTGTQTSVHIGLLLLIGLSGLWIFNLIQGHTTLSVPTGVLRPLIALLLVASLAFLVGQLPWFAASSAPVPAQLGGLALYVLCAVSFLLPADQIRELKWLKWMTWLFLGISSFYIVGQVFAIIPLRRIFQFGATGSLFWLWVGALAFSQAFLNRKLHRAWRLMLLLLVAGTLYTSYYIFDSWNSAWMPMASAIITIIILQRPALIVIFACAALIMGSSLVSQLIANDAYSLATRIEAWEILAQIVQVSPILGLGPANYFYYTPLYSIRGYHVRFNSHNQYVDLVAQTGILSLVCYIWFLWEVGRRGFALLARFPDGFARAYVYGALGGLAGTIISGFLGDWIIPFVYNVGFHGMRSGILSWLFLGGLIALYQMAALEDIERLE